MFLLQMGYELNHISDAKIPEKFDRKSFQIWQREMQLYLSYLKLDKYLCDDKPVNPFRNTDVFILASEEA